MIVVTDSVIERVTERMIRMARMMEMTITIAADVYLIEAKL